MLNIRTFFLKRDIPLNIAHFIDHFCMLIFAKAAYDCAIYFNTSYGEIIIYATLGLILFGAFAPLASYLSKLFSRKILLIVFPIGVGFSSIFAGFSQNLIHLGITLTLIGIFASIYHPVGIAMLMKNKEKLGLRLGINGVWGNMGVAFAPLITGLLIFYFNWRISFILPGMLYLLFGLWLVLTNFDEDINETFLNDESKNKFAPKWKNAMISLILITIAGGFTFGSLTFLIPRYFDIYMSEMTKNIFITGLLASAVYAIASFAQVLSGWLVDRKGYRTILIYIGIFQILFIFLTSQSENLYLFIFMLLGMAFVFSQIPISDIIISAYIPDENRSEFLSIKYVLNLCIGALILPVTGFLLKIGFELNFLFFLLSFFPLLVILGAFILPSDINKIKKKHINI